MEMGGVCVSDVDSGASYWKCKKLSVDGNQELRVIVIAFFAGAMQMQGELPRRIESRARQRWPWLDRRLLLGKCLKQLIKRNKPTNRPAD
jgi:hypothetical protein